MPAHEDFVPNNALYAESFDKGHLSLPPARKLIVVTCMDARLEPASQLGLKLGDAHVIRNAGGSAQVLPTISRRRSIDDNHRRDALRSVIISQRLLGTREIAVVKHTDCGMTTFTTEDLRNQIIEVSPGDSAVATAVKEIDFLEFSQLEEAVKGDVKFLRENPLVLRDIPISGWIYDVKKGEIQPVSW